MRTLLALVFVCPMLVVGSRSADAQALSSTSDAPAAGIGVKVGTLGVGVQGAVRVAPRVAVRGGFNFFSYGHTFTQDGTNFDATLKLQSIEASLDLGLGGGFRFSPGVLLRNNNHLDAVLSVPAGQQFSLGGSSYISQAGTPLGGTGLLDFKKFAPMLGIGFGSLVPRGNRHVTVAFDLGVVFQDSPNVALTLSGNACLVAPNGTAVGCAPVNSLPGVAANIASEQTKVSDSLKFFKYYPVTSVGVGWKF